MKVDITVNNDNGDDDDDDRNSGKQCRMDNVLFFVSEFAFRTFSLSCGKYTAWHERGARKGVRSKLGDHLNSDERNRGNEIEMHSRPLRRPPVLRLFESSSAPVGRGLRKKRPRRRRDCR